jgi:hypothetical protein
MERICESIRSQAPEVLIEWENVLREQPWYSLPAEHRTGGLADVVVGIADASLCEPGAEDVYRELVLASAAHGTHRREQDIPDHLILIEYHLLRQALWRFLTAKFGSAPDVVTAIMRIDMAITVATNASMWGYHRPEVEALGKWEVAIERIVADCPFPRKGTWHDLDSPADGKVR